MAPCIHASEGPRAQEKVVPWRRAQQPSIVRRESRQSVALGFCYTASATGRSQKQYSGVAEDDARSNTVGKQ